MKKKSFLVTTFFDDRSGIGFESLRQLASSFDAGTTTTYVQGRKQTSSMIPRKPQFESAFNLVELVSNRPPTSEVNVLYALRYRPAVSSPSWAPVGDFTKESVPSAESKPVWNLFMTLSRLERLSRKYGSRDTGVIELLCNVETEEHRVEEVLAKCFSQRCPGLATTTSWGVANFIPFRELSIEEEWEAASAMTLWVDLSTIQQSWNQYVFAGQESNPQLPLVNDVATVGQLSVFQLETPKWVSNVQRSD